MRHYFRLNRVGCGIPRQLRPTGLDPTGATIVPCAGSHLLRVCHISIARRYIYRHVTPKGEIRPDGEKLLSRCAR